MPMRAFSSSVATKLLVGITGLALFVYLIVHIAGNLVVFLGRDAFNTYAATLGGNPLIPIIEIGLLLILLVHIYKTVTMVSRNRRSRPLAYAKKERAGGPSRKSFASSTMIVSGLWLVVFMVLHVSYFRFGAIPEASPGVHDLYAHEMAAFRSPGVVAFYVLSMVVVGMHLSHGVASAAQSLGLDHPTWTPRVLIAGKVFAALIAVGFIVIALWAHFVGGVRA